MAPMTTSTTPRAVRTGPVGIFGSSARNPVTSMAPLLTSRAGSPADNNTCLSPRARTVAAPSTPSTNVIK